MSGRSPVSGGSVQQGRGLHARVREQIRREELIPPHGRVVIALSGGSDSVALTLLLGEVASDLGFTIAGVAHLNHWLRGSAREDERFCRGFAQELSLPIVTETVDVSASARLARISLEDAGHRERYQFFNRTLESFGADRVATAHTRDDQAETVLMRLLRGAGPGGLGGIYPQSGRVIRPLLGVGKNELRSFLAERGQTYHEDETNADVNVTRNRVRHELIPLLERRFSPSVMEALARDANIARHDSAWLESVANVAHTKCVIYRDGTARLEGEPVAGLPTAVARRVVKQALERIAGATAGFDQVERVLTLSRSQSRRADADLPGCRVSLRDGLLTIRPPRLRRLSTPGGPEATGFEYRLPVPGQVCVVEAGVVLSSEEVSGGQVPAEMRAAVAAGQVAYVDGRRLLDGLVVRSRKPGDALRPLGLGGRKKLQDVFVDRKVPRAERKLIPVVTDTTDGIVWVVGHGIAEDFRVTSASEGMLILKARSLKEVGGAG